MEAVYVRRRTLGHKLIKYGVLAVVLISFVALTADLSLPPQDEVISTSKLPLSMTDHLDHHTSLVSGTSRSLLDTLTGCKKPGQKGTQAQICAYIKTNCPKDSGDYIDYLDLFYCSKWMGGNRALGWASLIIWILALFLALGTISNDYFVPALTSVAYTLSIPAEIAGLTLLAFGNGAPNVAGYFAAVTNKTFDLAIGDVFGGSFYVVSVVLAFVCFFGKDIALDGHSFKRDVAFLTVACTAVFIFIWTGRFYIYESIALLVFYLAYVLWATIYDLMRQRRTRLALKRARLAAGLPMPTKRSYRSRSSVFKKQSIINFSASQAIANVDANSSSVNHTKGPASPPRKHFNADLSDTNPRADKPEKSTMVELDDDAIGNPNNQGVHSVLFAEQVQVAEIPSIQAMAPATSSEDVRITATTDTPTSSSSSSSRPRIGEGKPKWSTRTLRAAFAKVSTSELIGRTLEVELSADVEDLLAPPISGHSVEDNAVDDGSLVIPNLHLYQENLEEELEEIQTRGAYVWTVGHWKRQFLKLAIIGKLFYIFTYPLNVPLFLTIPTTRWNRATSLVSLILGWPVIFGALGFMTTTIKPSGFPIVTICIAVGCVMAVVLLFFTETGKPPKFKIAFLFWAFIISVAWIYLIANELINTLQAIGRILSIADILLGATVLTWGNSISDFVADTALAARGDARIAMGALYGGPMFNMAFGIGAATLYGTIRALPNWYAVTPTVLFWLMGTYLLFVLVGTFISVAFFFNYRLRWWLGIPLIYLYITYFVVVVLFEVGVVWPGST